MTQTTANQHPRDRMRGRIDRGVQAAVTASGLMVLMTLMLIFVYLLFAVLPLFKPASLGRAAAADRGLAPALALGMDVQQRVGYRIDAQGAGNFIALRRHRTASPCAAGAADAAGQTGAACPKPPESAICSRWRRPTAGWWWRARILRRRKTAGRSGCSRSGSSRWRWIRSASR